MANYAFLDMNNIVTEVVAGRDEGDTNTNWELEYQYFKKQICKRTSYNTLSGKHLKGKAPFRKNYAGIGYTYDSSKDAFIPPKPFASWTLNETTCLWQPPVPHPNNGKIYKWDEDNTRWVEAT